MKLTITGWSFPRCSLEEAAAIARALGFEAMDVDAYPGGHLDRAAILGDLKPELRRLEALGLPLSNMYWTFGDGFAERALNSPDLAVRQQNNEDFRRVVDFCHAAGIPSIMLLPGILHPGQTRGAAMDACMEAAQDLAAISQAAGIEIALEPHLGGLLESPDDALQVATETPNVKLALDYSHFIAGGYAQAEVDPLTCYAAHMHMRQAKPGWLQTRLEYGTINFPLMIDTLRCACYEGYLAVEYVHQDYLQTDNVDVISETVKMRDLLASYVRTPGRGRGQAPCANCTGGWRWSRVQGAGSARPPRACWLRPAPKWPWATSSCPWPRRWPRRSARRAAPPPPSAMTWPNRLPARRWYGPSLPASAAWTSWSIMRLSARASRSTT